MVRLIHKTQRPECCEHPDQFVWMATDIIKLIITTKYKIQTLQRYELLYANRV